MSEILSKYGLAPDPDEHPASPNAETLSKYGLTLDPDEHPASGKRMVGTRELEDKETDPNAKRSPNPPAKSMLQSVHEAIDPSTVVPAVVGQYARNTGDYAASAGRAIGQGFEDFSQGRPASGVGNVGLGALSGVLSPVAGGVKTFVDDPLTQITGNPQFGERAAMMFPLKVGAPATQTVLHNAHPTTRALDEVINIAGPQNVPSMVQRMESNPRLRPIDTSDQLRMAGQGLIASPRSAEASKTLTENMRSSAAGARDAVRGTYDEAMGAPPNLFEEYQKLEAKAKAIGQSKIAPPIIASKPVDTSGVLADIDKALNPTAIKMTPGTTITPTPLQQKLMDVRRDLATDTEVLTDAGRLHELQSSLRREAEDLLTSATGADRKLGRELMNYRNKLVDAIDKSAPGYKEGLKAYKDQKDIERAFEFGRDALVNGKDLKHDPSYMEQWVKSKDRTPEELAAARLGARQAVESKMGSIKASALDPARSGTDVPQIEFNKKKLEHLFGKEDTDKMFQHLMDERDIAMTNNRSLGNSKTAETRAYQQMLEPRDIVRPTSQLPAWATAMGMGAGALTSPTVGALVGGTMLGARGAKSMYDWMARNAEIKRNASIADIITSNNPEIRSMLLSAAQKAGQRNKLQNLIAPP